MSIKSDWRSIRYEEKYNWQEIPKPLKEIPIELRRWVLLPDDVLVANVNLATRPFSDNSISTLKSINQRLEYLRVKLVFFGLHKRTSMLVYYFVPIRVKGAPKMKNPWYNFILVWSLGDYPPQWWFEQCLLCARRSEEYYGQRGIYMNMRKRSQRWRAKQKGRLKLKPATPLESSKGKPSQEKT